MKEAKCQEMLVEIASAGEKLRDIRERLPVDSPLHSAAFQLQQLCGKLETAAARSLAPQEPK